MTRGFRESIAVSGRAGRLIGQSAGGDNHRVGVHLTVIQPDALDPAVLDDQSLDGLTVDLDAKLREVVKQGIDDVRRLIGNRKNIIIRCNPKLVSQIIGQKKSNIAFLADKGVKISVIQDTATDYFEIEYP